MAQRLAGPHSPQRRAGAQPGEPAGPAAAPRPPLRDARPAPAAGRVNAMFVVPFVFVASAFLRDAAGPVPDLAAFGLLLLAAWLTREGVRAQEAWEARSVARRPAIPRKLFAAVLTGAGVALGAWAAGASLLQPLALGAVAGVLHVVSFGLDPMRDKGMEGVDRAAGERVARAIEEAEAHLAGMADAILRTRDRDLAARVERFSAAARRLFRTVENDPRDLSAARKYLSVYLQGARDATVKFADHYDRTRDGAARGAYEALLTDLETTFARRSEALMAGGNTDLDVEIAVLRDRLKLET
jgi:hypothetical protein